MMHPVPHRRHSPRNNTTRIVTLAVPRYIRIVCFLLSSFALWYFFQSKRDSYSVPKPDFPKPHFPASFAKRLNRDSRRRLAIIIPFIGKGPEDIPSYMELFCNAAAGSESLVDFLLFHNGILDRYEGDKCPPNVMMISMRSTQDMALKLVKVVDHLTDEKTSMGSKDRLAYILSKYIMKYPYVLVEFKPALGYIFAEYLEGYTHWGYSDLDIIFGDLPRWITEDELTNFDIVTYGYGDQHRLYLRGQFTFHRNDPKINQLWRSCDYLSHMDKRFNEVLHENGHLHFESAEGCYPSAIMQTNDIRVKFAVKAFTDIKDSDTSATHGLYLGTGMRKQSSVIYKAQSKQDGKALLQLDDTWFERKDSVYAEQKQPLLYEIGERERLPLIERDEAKCMYWVQQKYQSRLCVEGVKPTDTVYWIDGQLYKQPFERVELPNKIVTGPFFHFQEWKRYYRTSQLSGFHRTGPVRTFVLSKEGVLPLYHPDYTEGDGFVPSPLGVKLYSWHSVRGEDRSQLPHHSYCLRSGRSKGPSNILAPHCQQSTSWRDKLTVEIISPAPGWSLLNVNKEITMALTLQISAQQAGNPEIIDGYLDLIARYLNRWQGQPSVLLIHVAGADTDVMAKLRIKLGPRSDLSYYGIETCLVAAIFSRSDDQFSRKALLNMATDVAPTRWVMSGFELERGIVISHDSAFFAHRLSRIYEDMPGSVFIVPQFGAADEEGDFTLPSLSKLKSAGNLKALPELDPKCEEEDRSSGTTSVLDSMVDYWWETTEPLLSGNRGFMEDSSIEKHATTLDKLQIYLISLLTEDQHYSLYAMDESPILLVDNLGPRTGMVTSDFVREVEEFGGKVCYNALRLAQLAAYGYKINVLSGAFALSTPATRKAAFAGISCSEGSPGESRSDVCFLFPEEEDEEVLEGISRDERKRPAKAALLWEHGLDSEPLSGHT